jgi:hypothetical protein
MVPAKVRTPSSVESAFKMMMAVRGRASPVNWLPNWEIVSEVQSFRKLGFRQSVLFLAVAVSMSGQDPIVANKGRSLRVLTFESHV